ncbi:ATP-binding protein [Pseudomonas sp. AP42]|uniref:P-loop NTPase n=1 Tax=Pseudomonas sp. AP42 TaxID=1535632 RepID=UPI00084A74A9|nr:ATP-binding protein [Pseudomonas sp. AP42]OEC56770.1 hypothetical protein A7K61_22310 [Pseudomonas sp. AP42]
MGSAWSVDGNDLNTQPRTGGAIAEKGFSFQKAYALVRLTWLLTGERELVELRYEGAQDVDLRFAGNRELLIQAKDHQQGSFSYSKLKDVIAGFARDMITVTAREGVGANFPGFRLVCTSAPYEESAFQILRRVFIQNHAQAIAPLISEKYREGLDEDQVLECLRNVLGNATFEILLHEEAIADLTAQASWNLVRFGVPPEHVRSSITRLKAALVPRASFQVSDVVENLVGLPDGHPGKDGAACRLLPAKRSLVMTSSMRTAFLHGAVQSLWAAVANGLDVSRSEVSEVVRALADIRASGGMVVVQGNSGTGKSALVRRIAWDAHQAGTHLVLEVVVPGEVDDASWKAVLSLLMLSSKPLLLIVDDVWRHSDFVEALERHIRPGLCVLGTSRPVGVSQKSEMTMLAIHPVRLGPLSTELVEELRDLISTDREPAAQVGTGQIARFMEHGQLLALSLTLQGGSLNEFAANVLRPLRTKAAFHDFLDLCVPGSYDQSAPLSLFERIRPDGIAFWKDESFFGLVSLQKTKNGVSRLKVGHSLVAQAILENEHLSIVDRAIQFCDICDSEMVAERRFVVRLLRDVLADDDLVEEVKSKRQLLADGIQKLFDHASFSDAHRLAKMLLSLGQPALEQKFLAAAKADRVIDSVDVGLALSFRRREDYEELYPRMLEFFEREPNAPGRRRFVYRVQDMGSPAQQLVVIEQTASWVMKHNFPADETLAVLQLGVSATERAATLRLEPMIEAYIESERPSITILNTVISAARRMKLSQLSLKIIRTVISVLRRADAWDSNQKDLVRRVSELIAPEHDAVTRAELGKMIVSTFESSDSPRKLMKAVTAAIIVGDIGTITPIREAINAMRIQGWQEADQIERHFIHKFKHT